MNILGIFVAFILYGMMTASCFANCEAGSFTIHTIAEYKKADGPDIYLLYQVADSGELQARLNGIDSPASMKTSSPSLTVVRGDASCNLKSTWQLDPKFDPDDHYSSEYPYRMSFLKQCGAWSSQLPKKGYALFKKSESKVVFPRSLELREEAGPLDKDLQAAIDKDLASRKLYLFTMPNWRSNETSMEAGPIEPSMVQSRRFQVTRIGEGKAALRVVTVWLAVKDAAQAFPKDGGSVPQQLIDNPKQPLDYPVIYFIHPKLKSPLYVGDGSSCSNVALSKTPDEELPAQFRPIAAFDLNVDGIVDLLEINERFTYSIDAAGKPTVIHYGLGC